MPIAQTLQTQVDIEDKVTEDIADDVPIVQQTLQTQFIKIMSEREADEEARFGEVLRWSDDDRKDEVPITSLLRALKKPAVGIAGPGNKHADVIGKKMAKDFGSPGVFMGTIMNVEYDSEDVGHEAPFYVVEYTDGDREDLMNPKWNMPWS